MSELIFQSFLETLVMTFSSVLIGVIAGTPLGIILYSTAAGGLSECLWLNRLLSLVINTFRSIPYIILTVLLIPLTRVLTGSSIGTLSTLVPLGFYSTLLVARMIEDTLRNVSPGLIEVGTSMGASQWQITRKILLPECLPSLISGLTLIIVSVIGMSAMAGAVGGGGLGDLAIRYGYQRFNLEVLAIVVFILVGLVQSIQISGDQLSKKLRK